MSLFKTNKKAVIIVSSTIATMFSGAMASANEFITSTGSNKLVILANESAGKAQGDTGLLLSGSVGDYVILFIIGATVSAALGLFFFKK